MEYTNRVRLNKDGVYRWYYDVDMRKNPHMLQTLMTVMAIIGTIIAGILAAVLLIDKIMAPGTVVLIVLGIYALVFGIGFLSYLPFYLMQHGVSRYSYEMNADGIFLHMYKAEQIAGSFANIVDVASSVTGHSVRNMRPPEDNGYTAFKSIRKIILDPEKDAIYIRTLLVHNYAYVCKEDYEFVKNYFLTHKRWNCIVIDK